MKKLLNLLFLLPLLVCPAILTSCSDDDDVESGEIVGTWVGTDPWDKVSTQYLHFESNNKGISVLIDRYDGKAYTSIQDFSWSVSGNTLAMNIDGESNRFTIENVDSKSLTLSQGASNIKMTMTKCAYSEMAQYLN